MQFLGMMHTGQMQRKDDKLRVRDLGHVLRYLHNPQRSN